MLPAFFWPLPFFCVLVYDGIFIVKLEKLSLKIEAEALSDDGLGFSSLLLCQLWGKI